MQASLTSLLAGRQGHFQMESGHHGGQWFDLDALFSRPDRLRPFVAELAKRLSIHDIWGVCGPMTGGAELAALLARELNVEYLFTDRLAPPQPMGFFSVRYELPLAQRDQVRRRRIAIVDDGISAGSAVRSTYDNLRAAGAEPVVVGALFVFGDGIASFVAEEKLPLEGIAHVPFPVWSPAECPLCQAGVKLEKIPA